MNPQDIYLNEALHIDPGFTVARNNLNSL